MARQCRVLIVEDEEEIQGLLRNALSLEGYDVTTTGTTPGELHNRTLTDYDILIIDFASTGNAGLTAAVRARALGIGVIVVGSDAVHPGDSVGHAHLMKPLSLSALSELIRETLERTKAECKRPLGPSSRVS